MNCIKVWNAQQIRIRASDRYVCITDMARATGKQVGHWNSLQNTTGFIQALSEHTGIAICDLITTSRDNTIGTWAHPQIAIDFAGWSCFKFKIQVTSWVDELLTTGRVSLSNDDSISIEQIDRDTKLAKQMVELACQGISIAYAGLNLKPELLAGLKLNVIEQVTPELKPLLQESRQLLINETAQEHQLLTATQIGERLGISAQAVNKKLVALGLQVKNDKKRSKKDCSYVAAGQGAEFSELTLATGFGSDSTTYQQLRWYDSVLTQL